MNNDKAILKEDIVKEHLSKRDLKFIQYRIQGLKVPEAYKLAGFKGNDNSAYVLSYRLAGRVNEIIKQGSFNSTELMLEVSKLVSLPLRPDQNAVTVDQKIKVLRLFKDALPEQDKKQSFTQFTIINGALSNDMTKVVDVTNDAVVSSNNEAIGNSVAKE